MSLQERWLDVDGQHVHVFVAGENGTPVVLLHGAGVDSAYLSWAETIGSLASRHRVFAPDLPGYGQSDKPDIVYSMDFYVGFVAALLDALQLERVNLIGLSLGGGIALGFALRFPARIDRLVLAAPYGIASVYPNHKLSYLYVHSPLNELSYRFFRFGRGMIRASLLGGVIHNSERVTPALVDAVYKATLDPQVGKAFASFQRHEISWNGIRTNYVDRLHEIQAPALFLGGTEDRLVLAPTVLEASKRVPNGQVHIFEGAAHWLQRDKPDEFNRLVLEFLDSTPRL